MSDRSGCRWGTHAQFARLYDTFLDAVYPPPQLFPEADGRRELALSIGRQIKAKGGGTVLDCAAGTGFPALDLAADGFEVHCSDGDPAMAEVLATQARRRGLDVVSLAPPRRPGIEVPPDHSPLVLNWIHLERIPLRYNYVLCRGNSLAYADTWNGQTRTANDQVLATYLERILWRVKPGGYLHVDAPWQLALPTEFYRPVGTSASIWEQVTADETHREWMVSFKDDRSERPLAFRRYSSLLTIDRVETILKALGMEETGPFQLDGERSAFGTIIARRPKNSNPASASLRSNTDRRQQLRLDLQTKADISIRQHRRSVKPRAGTHAEFVDRYETYLDAIYDDSTDGVAGSGRWRLMDSIASAIEDRRAVDVLDCAAGTGFPLLEVAAGSSQRLRVNCSDGDQAMVDGLITRAEMLGLSPSDLTPPQRVAANQPDSMVVDWTDLDSVTTRYDYVLCRGNSLAYANTWNGDEHVADEAQISRHLATIAARVRLGGYLHVDAPWNLDLEPQDRFIGADTVWEQVSVDRDRREWWLKFTEPDRSPIEFKRYSSLLTIHRVKTVLDQLGFEETNPFELPGERASFGVIIARKPR